MFVEIIGRFQKHSNSNKLVICLISNPMLLKFFTTIPYQSLGWVGYVKIICFNLIKNNKMVLIPMKDAR